MGFPRTCRAISLERPIFAGQFLGMYGAFSVAITISPEVTKVVIEQLLACLAARSDDKAAFKVERFSFVTLACEVTLELMQFAMLSPRADCAACEPSGNCIDE